MYMCIYAWMCVSVCMHMYVWMCMYVLEDKIWLRSQEKIFVTNILFDIYIKWAEQNWIQMGLKTQVSHMQHEWTNH